MGVDFEVSECLDQAVVTRELDEVFGWKVACVLWVQERHHSFTFLLGHNCLSIRIYGLEQMGRIPA